MEVISKLYFLRFSPFVNTRLNELFNVVLV